MFKKSERLSKSEFTHFFGVGARRHTKHLTVITFPYPNPNLKVAVVVGKKVAKSAVRRNTLKRRVSASLRKVLEQQSAGVFIVLVKPSFATLPRKTAEQEVVNAIAQVMKSA